MRIGVSNLPLNHKRHCMSNFHPIHRVNQKHHNIWCCAFIIYNGHFHHLKVYELKKSYAVAVKISWKLPIFAGIRSGFLANMQIRLLLKIEASMGGLRWIFYFQLVYRSWKYVSAWTVLTIHVDDFLNFAWFSRRLALNVLQRGHSNASAVPSISLSSVCYLHFDLLNLMETKLLCAYLSNLADMLTMIKGWTLLILEVRGKKSQGPWQMLMCTGDARLVLC